MDYDSRKIKWYWLVLFVAYCGGVVYLLFSANPYLYSHYELNSSMSRGGAVQLFSFPADPGPDESTSPPTYFPRYDAGNTGIDPLGSPRSKNYEEYQQFPVDFALEDFTPEQIAHDQSGFYLTGKGPWVVSVGLDGAVKWKFKLSDLKDEKSIPTVMLDERAAYVVHPDGEVLSLDKIDGRVRWLIDLDRELMAAPFFWKSQIVVPLKAKSGSDWVRVHRTTGKSVGKPAPIDVKPGFLVSQTSGGKSVIVVSSNKVIALDPETWKVDWAQTLTDPIQGPAAVVDGQIYVATLGSKVIKLDAGKKGKVEWEVELDRAPASAPTYLPVANRLSVMLDGGILAMIEAKLAKVLWTYNTLNKSPLNDSWSVRISAKHIEEYKMDWLHKGWTTWAPCSNRHFCMFTPNKGQLIQSVAMSALPLALPLQMEKRWIFFGRAKDDKYLISHMLEAAEIKRLRQEAAAAAQKAQGQ